MPDDVTVTVGKDDTSLPPFYARPWGSMYDTRNHDVYSIPERFAGRGVNGSTYRDARVMGYMSHVLSAMFDWCFELALVVKTSREKILWQPIACACVSYLVFGGHVPPCGCSCAPTSAGKCFIVPPGPNWYIRALHAIVIATAITLNSGKTPLELTVIIVRIIAFGFTARTL